MDRALKDLLRMMGIPEDEALEKFRKAADLSKLGQTQLVMAVPTIEFTLHGITSAKKNRYTPAKGKMFKGRELQAELDSLEMQVPGPCRDLCLEHPDIDFYIKTRSSRRDRDGIVTGILDVMVKCRVIVEDNVKHFNGRMTIHPAEVCDEDSVRIVITPKDL